MSETARLAVVIACYSGLAVSLAFHGMGYSAAAARLISHVRDHHPREWARRGAPTTALRGVFPVVAVWNWVWSRPAEMESCAAFVACRRRTRFIVYSLGTTALVLLATAQAFWSTLD